MKSLTLLRHAKSSWKDPFRSDFDRPLSGRGKREAPIVAERLRSRGIRPDLIITSAARRARKTAGKVAKKLGYKKSKILKNKDIYNATYDVLLDVVRNLDEGAGAVLMVGHNPGFTDLANALADGRIETLPTSGAVTMELPVESWSEVKGGIGRILSLEAPRRTGGGGG